MKILFVFDRMSPIGGGSQITALLWMKALQKRGHTVKLLCNTNAKNFLPDISPHNLLLLSPILSGFFIHKAMLTRIQQEQFAIIHFHEPTLISYWILRFAKKHAIPTIGSYQTNYTTRIQEKFQLYFLSQVTAITTPTQTYREKVKVLLHKDASLTPLPITAPFFRAKKSYPPQPTRLITISRLEKMKNVDVLIRAMKVLKHHYTLTIIGDGSQRKALETLTKELYLSKVITFLGWQEREKVATLLEQHDLFLSASAAETFGLTYIEALATRTPVVVYDYPVTKEVIPENMGVRIPSLDPDMWSKTLLKLQEHPKTYQALMKTIKKEYKKILAYHEDAATKHIIEVYQNVLKTQK